MSFFRYRAGSPTYVFYINVPVQEYRSSLRRTTNFEKIKEFALIFRLKNIADFKPSPEQMQERMNWLGSIEAQQKLVDKGNTLLPVQSL